MKGTCVSHRKVTKLLSLKQYVHLTWYGFGVCYSTFSRSGLGARVLFVHGTPLGEGVWGRWLGASFFGWELRSWENAIKKSMVFHTFWYDRTSNTRKPMLFDTFSRSGWRARVLFVNVLSRENLREMVGCALLVQRHGMDVEIVVQRNWRGVSDCPLWIFKCLCCCWIKCNTTCVICLWHCRQWFSLLVLLRMCCLFLVCWELWLVSVWILDMHIVSLQMYGRWMAGVWFPRRDL